MNTTLNVKDPESQVKARFPDCDPFNHLNNSKYIDYMINAREDQLIQYYNFDVHKKIHETGKAWVIAQTQIAYLIPVTVMEIVTIQTGLLDFNLNSICLEAVMYDENKKHIKAVMWSRQVYYNLHTLKKDGHPAELMNLFYEMHNPLKSVCSFDERIRYLKKGMTATGQE